MLGDLLTYALLRMFPIYLGVLEVIISLPYCQNLISDRKGSIISMCKSPKGNYTPRQPPLSPASWKRLQALKNYAIHIIGYADGITARIQFWTLQRPHLQFSTEPSAILEFILPKILIDESNHPMYSAAMPFDISETPMCMLIFRAKMPLPLIHSTKPQEEI